MKRQDHFRRRESGWPGDLDVDVVTAAFADAPSGISSSSSSFHHHSTTTSGQSLLSDLGAFSSVTPASSGFGYSQKNFHISDGNLYSVLSPFQSRRSSNRPTFLRGHSCVTSTTTSTTHTASPNEARPASTTTAAAASAQRRTSDASAASGTTTTTTTTRPQKLKFHHQTAPSGGGRGSTKATPAPHGGGNDPSQPRASSTSSSSSSSTTRHFKSRTSSAPRPETTRFDTSTADVGDLGGVSSGSWFDTRFGEPMFTDRLHSDSGVDSLLSKRLKCHQQRRNATTSSCSSSMDMEEEEDLKEETKHDASSSRLHHRRRLFDEHLRDWDSEEISLSSSKRLSSSSSYRRRFSSSTSCTGSTAAADKWDMDEEEATVYDRPLNLCMSDRSRKAFAPSAASVRYHRPDLDVDASSSASKLTIADDSEDEEDGDTFPFGGGGRDFRRDRKLNFSSLFDDLHSSVRSRRSTRDTFAGTSATAQPPTKERATSGTERDVPCRPKVEARDNMDEEVLLHSVFDYAEPRVLDLSTKRRLSQSGKSSAFTPFGQKRSSQTANQLEGENVFQAAAAAGRSPVIVQQSSSGYEVPTVNQPANWKSGHKRFPQMSEMFENLRLQDDDLYQSAVDRYQRYQVLRERLMETHPEMFVGWDERDRYPPPAQQHQPPPPRNTDTTACNVTVVPPNYEPERFASKDSLQDCPKLHRPPASPQQRPRSWDLPRASFTQTPPAAQPASTCTISVNAGPDEMITLPGIVKSESADACLESSRSYHHPPTPSAYNFPLTTSATFPMCPTSDGQTPSGAGTTVPTMLSSRSEVTLANQQQWLPYSGNSQLLPPQPTVIRVVPCGGDAASIRSYPTPTPPVDVKSRPPTPSTSGGRGVSKSKQPEPKIKTDIGGGVICHSRYKTRQRSAAAGKSTAHHQADQMTSTSHNQYNNDISICKFKLIKGVNPVLEEKKSFFVPLPRASSAQQLFSSHQQISGMGDLCHHASRDSSCPPLSSGGVTVGFPRSQPAASGIVKSASTGTAVVPTDRVTLLSQSLAAASSGPLADKFRNFKIHVGSQEEMGRKMGAVSSGPGGAPSGSGGAKRLRRRSRKALAREKLEATFREQGFLIKTQQVSSAEGAVYCKFRQLKKFTRYLFKSWKDYLPKDLDEMSAAEAGQLGQPNAPPGPPPPSFNINTPLVLNPTVNPDPS